MHTSVSSALLSQFSLHHAHAVYTQLALQAALGAQLTNAELGRRLDMSRSTVAKCVTVLEQLGVIHIHYPDNGDKRLRAIRVNMVLNESTLALLQGVEQGLVVVDWSEARVVDSRPVNKGEPAVNKGAQPGDSLLFAPAFLLVETAESALESDFSGTTVAGGGSKGGKGGYCELLKLESCETKSSCTVDHKSETPYSPPVAELAAELLCIAGISRALQPQDRKLVEARLQRFLPADLCEAIRSALGLPGWNIKKSRDYRYYDLRNALATDELVRRLLNGELVHPVGSAAPKARQLEVQEIFKAWRKVMGYGAEHRLTEKQFATISERLDEGFTREQLLQIAQWIAPQPYYRGQNNHQKAYDDPCSIWRSKDRVLQNLRSSSHVGYVDRRFQELAASDAPIVATRY